MKLSQFIDPDCPSIIGLGHSFPDQSWCIRSWSNQDKEEKDKNGKVIRSERYTGSCSRKFYVGEGYKEEDFTAKFENGELMITFPKTEPEKIEEKKPIMIE